MKRMLTIVAVLTLAFLVAAVCLHFWWLHSAPQDERRSLVWPGSGSSSSGRPITVDVAPDLAAAGVNSAGGGSGEEVEVQVVLRVEKPYLLVGM